MYCFELYYIDSSIYALNINQQFKKYIKANDLDELKDKVGNYLTQKNILNIQPILLMDKSFKYELNLTKAQFIEMQHIFLYGTKNPIVLPAHLELSGELKKPVVHSHRDLSHFINYWTFEHSHDHKYRLYEQLSEDIIETPYVDMPLEYEYRYGKIAFHPNHGTTHGLRSVELFNLYIELITYYNNDNQDGSTLLTVEEQCCLELALFLFRSGRTNELGWGGDPTYSPRSAAIFTHIAHQLGFDTLLVKAIAACFDYQATIDLPCEFSTQSSRSSQNKYSLYQSIFKLCHMSDLIRCFSSYEYIYETIKEELMKLIKNIPETSIDELASNSLIFAAKCCKATGSPVAIAELQQESKATFGGNSVLAVNSVSDVVATSTLLAELRKNEVKKITIAINDITSNLSTSWFSFFKRQEHENVANTTSLTITNRK